MYFSSINFYFSNMPQGKVKFFNELKGFGFIVDDSDGQEVFVHATGLNQDITKGDDVEYDVKDGRKGLNAVNVSKL